MLFRSTPSRKPAFISGYTDAPSMTTSTIPSDPCLLSGSTPIKGASFSGEATSLPTRKRVFQEEDASSRTALVNRGLPLDLPSCGTQFHWLQGRPARTDLPSASASWQANSHASVRMASMSLTACRDRKSTRLNSSHTDSSRMPSSA